MSTVNCILYKAVLDNGSTETLCIERGVIPSTANNDERSECRTNFNDVILWQCLAFILFVLLLIFLICCPMYYMREKNRKKRERADTTSTNMVSVTTDEGGSVSSSLKMQDSQEQSCSSQEVLPRKPNNSTVTSIFTLGTTCTVIESKGTGSGGPAGELDGGEEEAEDIEGVLEVRRGEGEGRCDPFEPDSVGTTGGLHDMLSKLGESPDPSKAGGIWF